MRRTLVALAVVVLVLAGCGRQDQLIVINDGGLTVIVQPDEPVPPPGCPDCTDFKKVIVLDQTHKFSDELNARPGSVVRIFGKDCSPLDSFTFNQQAGVGQTTFSIDGAGHVSAVKQYNLSGDPAAGAPEHARCPT